MYKFASTVPFEKPTILIYFNILMGPGLIFWFFFLIKHDKLNKIRKAKKLQFKSEHLMSKLSYPRLK